MYVQTKKARKTNNSSVPNYLYIGICTPVHKLIAPYDRHYSVSYQLTINVIKLSFTTHLHLREHVLQSCDVTI